MFNGWQNAPEATYEVSFTLNGVCTVSGDVSGCTNSDACNYNVNATVDDGSCTLPYDVVYIDEDGDGYEEMPLPIGARHWKLGPFFFQATATTGTPTSTPTLPGLETPTTTAMASSIPLKKHQTLALRT